MANGGDRVIGSIDVCVPATGHTDVQLSTPVTSLVYGDLRNPNALWIERQAGVLLTEIAEADEPGGPCTP